MTVDRPAFRVLGPLEVGPPGRLLRIAGTKSRILLASLLLDANRAVAADHLAEILWPSSRPRSALANLRTYVSSLRMVLGETGGARILARPSGYLFEVPAGQLDVLLFEDFVAGARAAARAGEHAEARGDAAPAVGDGPETAGRAEDAAGLLDRALALWRGAPLADLPGSPLWDARLESLAGLRLSAAEGLAALRMERGQHAEAVAGLRGLLREHPFREDLWGRLMLALDAGGRQAEALDAYAAARRQLVTELGVEPGAELRRVHMEILAGRPAAEAAPPPSHAPVPVPRQLPPDVPDFTGRDGAVSILTRALTRGGRPPDGPPEGLPDGPPVVAVVAGPPGSGKTALAVHCAHAVRRAYPGGQIYLDLGGTASGPADPGELLAEALRALGTGEAGLPPTTRERSALYRSLLAGRQALVLLDDAADAAQVRPLLPGSGCAVVVTSRRRITELPGAIQVDLDVLTPAEAEELLGRIAGADRVRGEREAAAEILRSCDHLPLAVRIAGARLAARPGWPLAVLRRRLADETNRLGELRAGDLEVRGSFDRSYRSLPGDAARAFGALGLLGTRPLPGWVVGAVLGRERADDVTDALVDANLLRLAGTDALGRPRYLLPGLARCSARELAGGRDGPDGTDALARVLDGWTTLAGSAMERLPTTLFSLAPAGGPRWRPDGETTASLPADPLPWFDAERESLVEAVRLAADAGLAGAAWGLAAALVPYFDLRCHFDEWRSTHRAALEAAHRAGDRGGEAAMLRGLAQVGLYQDRYAEAGEMFTRSRAIFHELGDARGEAASICGLGAVNHFRGRHVEALGHFRRALAVFTALEDRGGEAYVRQAVGRVCLVLRDLGRASAWLGGALRLAREIGDPHREACVSMQFGRLHDLAADAEEAMRFQGYALDIFEGLGDRHCGAYALQSLGGLQVARGDRSHASERLQRSLEIFQQLGDRSGEAAAVQRLGELHRSAGRTGLARDYLCHARALRRELRGGAVRPTACAPSVTSP
ncbi:BTAD domain-containing putative transcriptional regulator [Streptosporangium sp. NPDC004379]|uniref:AfsR/SARP family transcriptional regulator n=1 Tax=Streptosporangium sp. NPDC004379 TaxID=3366189 RepID=UPI00369CACE1